MPAVGLGIYQTSSIRPSSRARQNKRKSNSVALIDDGSSPELGGNKRPAKYELTAANLTGNRLSGSLSGHPSLSRNDWAMTSCVSVSTLAFAIEQLVSRFKCRPHKSSFKRPAQTQEIPVLQRASHKVRRQSSAAASENAGCFVLFFNADHGTSPKRGGRVRRSLLLPARRPSRAPSALSRRLLDFYEYMYTAESGGGFVFISSR